MSEVEPARKAQVTEQLTATFSRILQSNEGLEEKVSKISFEIIDVAVPKRPLRYLLKALITGGHHIREATTVFKTGGKISVGDRLKAVRELGTIGLHLLTS
jgi:hypothetical protein